jgi:hypothetical protein
VSGVESGRRVVRAHRLGALLILAGLLHASCGGRSNASTRAGNGGRSGEPSGSGGETSFPASGTHGSAGRTRLVDTGGDGEQTSGDAGLAGDAPAGAGGRQDVSNGSPQGSGSEPQAGGTSEAGLGGSAPGSSGGAVGGGGRGESGATGGQSEVGCAGGELGDAGNEPGCSASPNGPECATLVELDDCQYEGEVCTFVTTACTCNLAGFEVIDGADFDEWKWQCAPRGCPSTEPRTSTETVSCRTFSDADLICRYGGTRACTCPGSSFGSHGVWSCYDAIECPQSSPAQGEACTPVSSPGLNECTWKYTSGTTVCDCGFDSGSSGTGHWSCTTTLAGHRDASSTGTRTSIAKPTRVIAPKAGSDAQ